MANLILQTREAKSFGKCCSCGETWRICEKFLAVVNGDTGTMVAKERYCTGCAKYARFNNDIELDI